jgi:hypothetical protein
MQLPFVGSVRVLWWVLSKVQSHFMNQKNINGKQNQFIVYKILLNFKKFHQGIKIINLLIKMMIKLLLYAKMDIFKSEIGRMALRYPKLN